MGLRCVSCDGTASSTQRPASVQNGQCVCSDNSDGQGVITGTASNGELLRAADGTFLQRCIICGSDSVPDPSTGQCKLCEYPKISQQGTCGCPAIIPDGARCSAAAPLVRVASALGVSIAAAPYSADAQSITDSEVSQLSVSDSSALHEHLAPAAAGCLDTGGREACNALANLCVLQRYKGCAAAS